jgi:integral membrane protein (TIGR01906 family)
MAGMKNNKAVKIKITKQQIIPYILITLFAITTPFVILLDNARQTVFVQGYEDILNETGTFQRVENAEDVNKNLINFFMNKEELQYFTAKEKEHMEDVKRIVNDSLIVYIILIIISFASFFLIVNYYGIRHAADALVIATIISMVKISLLGIIDFNTLFNLMHTTLFKNGTWIFDRLDLLIQMYSFEFFQEISKKIIINTGIQALTLAVFGLFLRKIMKNNNNNYNNNKNK